MKVVFDRIERFECLWQIRLIAICLVAVLTFQGLQLWAEMLLERASASNYPEIITVHSIAIEKPTVAGGELVVLIDRTKHIQCDSDWQTYIVGIDHKYQAELRSGPGSFYGDLERDTLRFVYALPDTLPNGRYAYHALGEYDCDGVKVPAPKHYAEFTVP